MTIQMEHNCYKYSCVPSFLLVTKIIEQVIPIYCTQSLFVYLFINSYSGRSMNMYVVGVMMNFLKKYFLPS